MRLITATSAALLAIAAAIGAAPLSASVTDAVDPPAAGDRAIVPGASWYDQHGNIAQLNGSGIFQSPDGTFYAVGEDKTDGGSFRGVACYSSPDLVEWTREGNALSVDPSVPDLAPASADAVTWRIMERPKVMYNASTGKYVMYMHSDAQRYSDSQVGVAISSTPCGPYDYLGSVSPLGNASRDMGVFQDDDGSGYLLSSDPNSHQLKIYALSDDYLTVESVLSTVGNFEAPAMVKKDGLYYLFGSQLSGWDANDNVYFTSPSLAGPWTSKGVFAPAGSKTYTSQTTFVFPVKGTEGTTYVYLGNRWIQPRLYDSAKVWLPLTISGGKASMTWHDQWTIDTEKGTWAPATSAARVEAEASGNPRVAATTTACTGCSGGTAVKQSSALTRTYDDHSAAIVFSGAGWARAKGQSWTTMDYSGTETFSGTAGDKATLSFTGTGVRVIGPRNTNGGMVEFSIDGVVRTAFSLRDPSGKLFGSSLFEVTDLAYGSHTLEIRVPGTKHPLSTDTVVSIDAIDVLDATNLTATTSVTLNGLTAPSAGRYTVKLRYAQPDMSNRIAYVSVNGGSPVPYRFPSTGSSTAFLTASIALPLQTGANSIRVFTTGSQRLPTLDYAEIVH